MRIKRTYPQPDSPEPHLGARERALAVFKYLLDLEPEAAALHPMFACIVHSYRQAEDAVLVQYDRSTGLRSSLVPMLTSERTVVADEARHVADEGKL